MESGALLASARRWWYLIAIGALIAALAGAVAFSQSEARYRAEADLLVGPVNAPVDTLRASSLLTQSYAEIAVSTTFLLDVRDRANLSLGADDLQEQITTTANDNTRVLNILVDSDTPATAALIANSVADELIVVSGERDDREAGRIRLLTEAVAPSEAVPRPVALMTLLSAVAGGVVMAVLAVLIDYLPWRRSVVIGPAPSSGHWLQGRVLALVPGRTRRTKRVGVDYKEAAARVLIATRPRGLSSTAIVPVGGATGAAAELAATMAVDLTRSARSSVVCDLTVGTDMLAALGARPDLREAGQSTVAGHPVTTYVYLGHKLGVVQPLDDSVVGRAVVRQFAEQMTSAGTPGLDGLVVFCPAVTDDTVVADVVNDVQATVVVCSEEEPDLTLLNETVGLLEAAGANIVGVVLQAKGAVEKSTFGAIGFRSFSGQSSDGVASAMSGRSLGAAGNGNGERETFDDPGRSRETLTVDLSTVGRGQPDRASGLRERR